MSVWRWTREAEGEWGAAEQWAAAAHCCPLPDSRTPTPPPAPRPRQEERPVASMQPQEGEAVRDCWSVAFGDAHSTASPLTTPYQSLQKLNAKTKSCHSAYLPPSARIFFTSTGPAFPPPHLQHGGTGR